MDLGPWLKIYCIQCSFGCITCLRASFVYNLHDSQILKTEATVRSLKVTSLFPMEYLHIKTNERFSWFYLNIALLFKYQSKLSNFKKCLFFQRSIQAWFRGIKRKKKKSPFFSPPPLNSLFHWLIALMVIKYCALFLLYF